MTLTQGAIMVKAALRELGVIAPTAVRLPLVAAPPDQVARCATDLHSRTSVSQIPTPAAHPTTAPAGHVRVVPLGGLGEVGRNMTVIEHDGRLLVVDCGVLFPEDHPGVDLILPDFDYIADRLGDIEAVVLTHGHEDHIGAVPYLLRGGANWTDRTMGLFNKFLSVQAVSGPHFNSVHLTNWLVNGMPERFPRLKVMWMESGIAWAVAAMLRLDNEYMMRSFDAPGLKRRPSSYMREMFYSTQPLERPEDMGLLDSMFRALKADTQLVWGSNFPSPDFDLPSVIYDLPFLDDAARRNILGGTAAKLFGLPPGR